MSIDSRSLTSYIHEIGHALGLGHPGPYGDSASHRFFDADSWQTTVMSPFDLRGNSSPARPPYPSTPMIADIIAVQNLYGVPADSNAGDTVYGYQSNLDGYLGQFFALLTGDGNPFINISRSSRSGVFAADITFVDLDGDGDPDLVINARRYFENVGTPANPSFIQRTGSANSLDGVIAGKSAFADLDGDGDFDLSVGPNLFEDISSFYENTGTATEPSFTRRTGDANPLEGLPEYRTSTFADLDGDGDPDFVTFTRHGLHTLYYENIGTPDNPDYKQRAGDGDPLFRRVAIRIDEDAIGVPEFTDLDGDGDLDFLIATEYKTAFYIENTGTPTEADYTTRTYSTGRLPNVNTNAPYSFSRSLEAVDLDGDSDFDLVIASSDGLIYYFENTGTTTSPSFTAKNFSERVTLTLYDSSGIDTLDLRTDWHNQNVDLRPGMTSYVYGEIGKLTLAPDTIIENLIAGVGDDRVIGNEAANHLDGGDGNDELWGNEGDDSLVGGAGADRLYGGAGSDTIYYQESDEAVTIRLRDGIGERGHAEGDLVNEIENVTGSDYGDVLGGDSNSNRLDGGGGDDGLWGGGGDDMLEGGAGADRLFGGIGTDWALYRRSDMGVTVNLVDGTGTGGHAQGDVITDIENVWGSAHADILIGDQNANRLEGGDGNDELQGNGGDDIVDGGAGADQLDGGAGVDWVFYVQSDVGVVVNLGDGTGKGGHAEGDVIAGIENVKGSNHPDVLIGSDGSNQLEGGAGADLLEGGAGPDRLYGGPGVDRVSYQGSDAGVSVSLKDGSSLHGHAQGDVIVDVEDLTGSGYRDELHGDDGINQINGGAGDDELWGHDADDILEGGTGADRLYGGAGSDWASYLGSDAGVTVSLRDGTNQGAHAQGDVIVEVENIIGSKYRDVLSGDERVNHLDGRSGDDELYGYGGNDTLEGGAGADRIDGGTGMDTLSFEMSNAAVTVKLLNGTGERGHAQGDSITAIENVIGSAYADVLAGDNGANRLYGGDGNDGLWGSSGDDFLDGGAGKDRLFGGGGADTISYKSSNTGVIVSLVDGAGMRGDAEGDLIADVENIEGSDYGDILVADNGINQLFGNVGNDELRGGDGDDLLEGGPGTDWLSGGAGSDSLNGGAGIDRASYQESNTGVTVNLESGTGEHGHAQGDSLTNIENLSGSAYPDMLIGDNDDNYLEGGAGSDDLQGSGGDDILEGGAGADRLDGGTGMDTISYQGADSGVIVRLWYGKGEEGQADGDVIVNIENIIGSSYQDVLEGDENANRLYGGGGDDLLHGSDGGDVLDGGSGVDTVTYEESYSGVSVNLVDGTGRGGYSEGDSFAEVENITGSSYSDVLVGDDNTNQLEGGAGKDNLRGNKGNDILIGGADADRLEGGDGTDWVYYLDSDAGVVIDLGYQGEGSGGYAEGDVFFEIENALGSAHNDELKGSFLPNILHGEDGDDILWGSRGNDILEGGAGDDWLGGGDGEDWLNGGAGADTFEGGEDYDTVSYRDSDSGITVNLKEGTGKGGHAEGDVIGGIEHVEGSHYGDMLVGGEYDNRLSGDDGDDRIWGNGGQDFLNGDDGADRLFGGDGHDRLGGGNGNDLLEGGAGDDRLFGGQGADIFVFDIGHGADILFDLTDGEDKIDLTAFRLRGFDDLSISSNAQGVMIDLSAHDGGTIRLENFDIASLDSSDFLF